MEGVLQEGVHKLGYKMIYIDVYNVREINSKSEEQYVYPCYAYAETCSQFNNYDLTF